MGSGKSVCLGAFVFAAWFFSFSWLISFGIRIWVDCLPGPELSSERYCGLKNVNLIS